MEGMKRVYLIMLGIVLLLLCSCAHPTTEVPLSIDVWTDKVGQGKDVPGGVYYIGDPITVYTKVNKNCTVVRIIQFPDSRDIIFGPWQFSAGLHEETGVRIQEPPGDWLIRCIAYADEEKAVDECWYKVTGVLESGAPNAVCPASTCREAFRHPIYGICVFR